MWWWINASNGVECDGPFTSESEARKAAMNVFPELDEGDIHLCQTKVRVYISSKRKLKWERAS